VLPPLSADGTLISLRTKRCRGFTLDELTAAGCVGFAQASQPIQDTQVLLRAMQYAHSFGYTVWLNPVDPFLSRGGVMHAGPFASRLGLPGNPVTSETVALHTICELVASVGCPVHLCRLSSAAGVELVRQALADDGEQTIIRSDLGRPVHQQ